ncbi:hypothetical protein [Atopobium fossor]|uniref:hypothetical protein n=1 Tax=Atopobium fossor TaxID=39487 RepID=UPI0004074CCF|nr:hypothetical protein [Atopobium fossor]
MKIHYFQRYQQKENVATANTMLLLSRLYQYSPDKFFRFLKTESDAFEPEVTFTLQEKSKDSVPDAIITQESFKIIVETKLSDWFYTTQLMNHIKAFSGEKYKRLLTLAPVPMAEDKKGLVETEISKHNEISGEKYGIVHVNMTFEELASAVQDVLDDRDYKMQAVLDDYIDYCRHDNLIVEQDSWKYLRMRLCGTTFDFNKESGLYYDKAEHGFRPHDYLGLYKNKSVRAVGKICARIVAWEESGEMQYHLELGKCTQERMDAIIEAIKDGKNYGYDLTAEKHRYFFVDQFIETDFKKVTPYAPMGARNFDLTDVLGTDDLPDLQEIASALSTRTWS